jgi:excinuclease ABC subunit B
MDIMEGALGQGGSTRSFARVADELATYGHLSPAELAKQVKALEKQMYEHARNLEFEEAARLRDQIKHMEAGNLGVA